MPLLGNYRVQLTLAASQHPQPAKTQTEILWAMYMFINDSLKTKNHKNEHNFGSLAKKRQTLRVKMQTCTADTDGTQQRQ